MYTVRAMATELKAIIDPSVSFDLLDVRLGRVVAVAAASNAPKPAYRVEVDFGKFGRRVSVGRFTKHTADELNGKLVMGVLNFPPRQIGDHTSEFLLLGVQFPKADSGEATPVTPMHPDAKLGSKLF